MKKRYRLVINERVLWEGDAASLEDAMRLGGSRQIAAYQVFENGMWVWVV